MALDARAMASDAVAAKPANPLLAGPILPTLLRLTLPNLAAMLVTALVAIAETAYVGILGTAQLAAIALVFPMVMLMQMLSAGAMGGGVSSAISRALGSGDEARAEALALHATVIGAAAGTAFSLLFVAFRARSRRTAAQRVDLGEAEGAGAIAVVASGLREVVEQRSLGIRSERRWNTCVVVRQPRASHSRGVRGQLKRRFMNSARWTAALPYVN
jgi:hypothetical protein